MFIDRMLEANAIAWGISPLIQKAKEDTELALVELLDETKR